MKFDSVDRTDREKAITHRYFRYAVSDCLHAPFLASLRSFTISLGFLLYQLYRKKLYQTSTYGLEG